MASRHELRLVDDRDHEFLVELHNDPLVLHNHTDPRPITLSSHMAWWSSHRQRNEEHCVFLVDNAHAGFCKFTFDAANNSVCLGADLHTLHRGRGLARPMWILMLERVFKQGVHRAWLTVAEYNHIGRNVYASLGFKVEGRLEQSLYRGGAYHDQIVMRLMEHEWFGEQHGT